MLVKNFYFGRVCSAVLCSCFLFCDAFAAKSSEGPVVLSSDQADLGSSNGRSSGFHGKNLTKSSDVSKENHVFEIENAIELAYEKNPELLAAFAQKRAIDESIAQAFSEFLPSVDLQVTTGISKNLQNRRSHDIHDINYQEKFEEKYSSTVMLKAYQNIFNGLGSSYKLKASDANVIANRFKLIGTEQGILFKVVNAYLNVWAAEEEVKICQKMEKNFAEYLKKCEAEFNNGLKKVQDLESFRASHAEAIYRVTSAKAKLVAAKAALEQFTATKVTGSVKYPSIPKTFPKSLDEIIKVLYDSNASVLEAKYSKYMYEYQMRVAKSGFSPRVDISAETSREYQNRMKIVQEDNPYGTRFPDHQKHDQSSVKASLTIPIWTNNGQNVFSSVRKSKEDFAAAEYSYDAAKRSALKSAIEFWANYDSSKAQVEFTRKSVKSAEVCVDGYKQEEQFGAASSTDVVYNENQLLSRRLQHVEAMKNYVLSAYNIMSVLGMLTPDHLNIKINKKDYISNESRVRHAPLTTH